MCISFDCKVERLDRNCMMAFVDKLAGVNPVHSLSIGSKRKYLVDSNKNTNPVICDHFIPEFVSISFPNL